MQKNIHYPKYAPENIKCPICRGSPLEIWAFHYMERGVDCYEPVLVCEDRCRTFFDMEICGTNSEELST